MVRHFTSIWFNQIDQNNLESNGYTLIMAKTLGQYGFFLQ